MSYIYTEKFFEESKLSTSCITFAMELVGLNVKEADKQLSDTMRSLPTADRNELVPLARYISSNTDFGFEVGETVRYHFSQHTIREGKILAINDGSVDFKEVTVPLSLVMSMESEPEQISLF